ncbi:MAG: SMC family ATPase [Synechococcales bacterium]|nr:SMC family ATPase [Synechococcales bacterium]
MEILSVTLKNFKSHGDRHFSFQPGTNAICGENGAGKTSILEAIAWVLFNYRGNYRKEDFIRNGASSAQATVSFVSSRDTRTYDVMRCTSRGYSLYDPQLGQRLPYTRIEDEVLPWLRQHLGVSPGTDLERLFENTIGVPQGTFTADFLLTAEKRKQVFDAVLKVEEYKQVYSGLAALKKYGDGQIEAVQRDLAHYEEALADWETVQTRHQQLQQTIQQDEATLTALEEQLTHLQSQRDQFAAQAQQVQQLAAQLQTLATQITGQAQARSLRQHAVAQAQQAVERCSQHRAGYEAYQQAEAALQALDQQAKQQKKLIKQRQTQQQALATHGAKVTALRLECDRLTKIESTLATLEPLLVQQTELEQQQAAVDQQLQHLQQCQLELDAGNQQLQRLRHEWKQLAQDIERLRSLEPVVETIPDMEQQRDRLQLQISRVDAARQFEAELRQLVATVGERGDRLQTEAQLALQTLQTLRPAGADQGPDPLAPIAAALESGTALSSEILTTLQTILADLAEQVAVPKLKRQVTDLTRQLQTAYQHRADCTHLEDKLAQQAARQREGEQLQGRLKELQAQLDTQAERQQQRSHLTQSLAQLDNPRGRHQLLHAELKTRDQVLANYQQAQAEGDRLEQQLRDLEEKLQPFADLEARVDEQQTQRQTHQPSYRIYLQNQQEADQLAVRQADLEAAQHQLQTLEQEHQEVQQAHDEAIAQYNSDDHRQLDADYTEARSQADQLRGRLPQQKQTLAELEATLAKLKTLAEKRDRAQADLKQKDRIKRFINFARKVYKEAGPRVTERYVQTISHEADRLFRELLNRPNVALEWTRDYEIIVQEGAHRRRFINLSGGEQMCAALAVRLALLRVLADIDVAFFDEPTTNMDRLRRQSLAEAIANIRTFKQLFVISHDDTFEQFTENIIFVERDA